MSELAALLAEARARRVFSAAAWSVGTADGVLSRGVLGTRSWDGEPAAEHDLWDLASVTKPIAGMAVLALVERGVLGLEDPVGAQLPEYTGGDKAGITVRQLLTHTSGLPGATPLWREFPTRAGLLDALRTRPLPVAPGSRVEYSSQGFILLGRIAEAASGRPLDKLVDELVLVPAGLRDTRYTPGAADRPRAVATEQCAWRGRLVRGEVHDENCVVLGGVAGHAGLFGTLGDLERLGQELAGGGSSLLGKEMFAEMTTCHTEGHRLRRGLGWQLTDAPDSPLGPNAYGHTGFTGTSLWIDPDSARFFVLLTNRVHPSRDGNAIVRVRRDFHRAAAR
ncbi:serine hydrolase domain-containing protein [Amycolatopsis nigrescens]|uniref:serine hydrolase domain-containing protein n=1 Tax=Amycolatopsis nigrescens TaxID=381445 RepID=UPI00035D7681|nr:serine hydrolase domain-containing protein [Amycolatopsis nigrescens]